MVGPCRPGPHPAALGLGSAPHRTVPRSLSLGRAQRGPEGFTLRCTRDTRHPPRKVPCSSTHLAVEVPEAVRIQLFCLSNFFDRLSRSRVKQRPRSALYKPWPKMAAPRVVHCWRLDAVMLPWRSHGNDYLSKNVQAKSFQHVSRNGMLEGGMGRSGRDDLATGTPQVQHAPHKTGDMKWLVLD